MTDYVYVLRCVNDDMTSSYSFKWPAEGYVEAPDWDPKPECGNGLHGFLWGEGNLDIAGWNSTSNWLVVKVAKEDIVDLEDKVKFPRGEVVFCGQRHDAANRIASFGATGPVHFVNREGGDKVNLVGGDYASLKAGYGSTLMAGYHSTLTAGYYSTLTAGDYSTLTADDHSTLTAGIYSTLTAGIYSTLTAGDNSTLTAGYCSTLTAGYRSTFTAGLNSVLIGWCVDTDKRVMAMVGQDGIEPNVKYMVKNGKFVLA